MPNVNVYIVEDSAITRAALKAVLQKHKFTVVGSTAKADVAWEKIQELRVDLLILDINLVGDKSGIWLAQLIKEELDIPFIYLTAYSDPSTIKNAVETKPYAYLTKPYSEATLITTIQIAMDKFAESKNALAEDEMLNLKCGNKAQRVAISAILFVQSEGNYVNIITAKRKVIIRAKLIDFKKELPEKTFMQVHNRYIVNVRKIDEVGTKWISIDNHNIPISRTYKNLVREELLG